MIVYKAEGLGTGIDMEYTIGSKTFGDWKIVAELGEGSFGKVFKVVKEKDGIVLDGAVKLIRIPKNVSEIKEALSEGMDEKSVTEYFSDIKQGVVREIAVMSQLKMHPNIVSCEDYEVIPHAGTVGWDILIRMELLTGLTDYTLEHPMKEADVIKMGKELCRALDFCQKKGLIHRDIKPGNIFVDAFGNFKLGDFGVARSVEKTMGGYSKQGTEGYMAPEVFHVKPYGANVDLYSLGIVLYRYMNGNRMPFYPPAPKPLSSQIREDAFLTRMKGEKELPFPIHATPAFAQVILKACAWDPKKRYRTAAEMLEALEQLGKETVTSGKGESGRIPKDMFIPPYPPEKEVDQRDGTEETYNPFDDGGDAGSEGTYNPFDDGGNAGSESTYNPFDGGGDAGPESTYNPFDDFDTNKDSKKRGKKKVETPFGMMDSITPEDALNDTDVFSKFFGGFDGDFKVDEKQEKIKELKEFWKIFLTTLWSSKRNTLWKAYITPDIPLQIYSNAMYNITGNQVKKDDIVAILDCTPDTRIPCGGGMIMTTEGIWIQLGTLAVGDSPASFIPYDVKDLHVETSKFLFTTTQKLVWTDKGKTCVYNSAQTKYVDYNQLIWAIKEWQKKG